MRIEMKNTSLFSFQFEVNYKSPGRAPYDIAR